MNVKRSAQTPCSTEKSTNTQSSYFDWNKNVHVPSWPSFSLKDKLEKTAKSCMQTLDKMVFSQATTASTDPYAKTHEEMEIYKRQIIELQVQIDILQRSKQILAQKSIPSINSSEVHSVSSTNLQQSELMRRGMRLLQLCDRLNFEKERIIETNIKRKREEDCYTTAQKMPHFEGSSSIASRAFNAATSSLHEQDTKKRRISFTSSIDDTKKSSISFTRPKQLSEKTNKIDDHINKSISQEPAVNCITSKLEPAEGNPNVEISKLRNVAGEDENTRPFSQSMQTKATAGHITIFDSTHSSVIQDDYPSESLDVLPVVKPKKLFQSTDINQVKYTEKGFKFDKQRAPLQNITNHGYSSRVSYSKGLVRSSASSFSIFSDPVDV